MKKELQKKLSFVLFVMAVFFAGLVLTVFSTSVLMICLAGVYLLAATVYYVWLKEEKVQTTTEKTSELLFADRMAELIRGNEKAEKGVYIAVKKQHEAMEKGLENLEAKLSELLTAQENAVKTMVLYNKENAKQIALSEREEIRKLREELTQLQQKDGEVQLSFTPVVDAIKEMSHRIYEEFHENGEAMLSELETTADCLDEIRELVRNLEENGVNYTAVAPAMVQAPVAAAPAETPKPVAEPEPAEEPEPVSEPEPVVERDPNQPLSQDDIAALFAGMEAAEPEPEPVAEPEPVVERDPNQPLSQDDIAALFAQMDTTEPEPEPIAEPEPVVERDPNQSLSQDDIAALFAQMDTTEPEPEPVAEEKPEDALASSGVDLSDPNKTLSADDIAALFAAMGN